MKGAKPGSWRPATVLAAALAAALPVYLQLFGSATVAHDFEGFVRLHLSPWFVARTWLTMAYFFLVIPPHVALRWAGPSGRRRTVDVALVFFLMANAIDLVYRAVQFFTVHGTWAAAYLASADPGAAAKIAAFREVATGVDFAFGALFAVSRALFAAGTWGPSTLERALAVSFGVVALHNAATRLGGVLGVDALSGLGPYYFVPWAANLLLLAAYLGTRRESVP